MNTSIRRHIAKAIYFTTLVSAIAVLWQAVRFCQGYIGAPGLDQIIALAQTADAQTKALSSPLHFVVGYSTSAYYFIVGCFVWSGIAVIVLSTGHSFGRIIEVGFDKFKAERRSGER